MDLLLKKPKRAVPKASTIVVPKEPTIEETCKENQVFLRRAQRQLTRDSAINADEEKRTIQEIKKLANARKVAAVKVKALELVRIKKQGVRLLTFASHIKSMDEKMSDARVAHTMSDAMKRMTPMIRKMNGDIKSISAVVMEFGEETDKMAVGIETIDDVFAATDPEDIEDADIIVDEVLEEIGINLSNMMTSPATTLPTMATSSKELDPDDAVLFKRWEQLKQ